MSKGCIPLAHIVSKWKYKDTHIFYYGMPQFATIDEAIEKIDNIELLNFCCPNKGMINNNSPYPKENTLIFITSVKL